MARVLIIDDTQPICETLTELVTNIGHEADSAYTFADGLAMAQQRDYDVVFLDVRLPDGSGLDLLSTVRELPAAPEVIIMTGAGDPDGAEAAIRNGAWDYVQKPLFPKKIILSLKRVLKYRDNLRELTAPPPVKRCGIVGESKAIATTLERMHTAAQGSANVLLTGETGSGKELFARALHENSPRAEQPFVVVDCAAIPSELMESTFFGHVQGAFTDAKAARAGLVSEADGGTLFLDELGELPLDLQRKLLRVLQERRFRAVGGTHEMTSNFRLVAATNRNLEEQVEQGRFRGDLLYRLSSVCIHIPPLRERMDDLDALVVALSERIYQRNGMPPKFFSPDFLEALKKYHWPGNVRELSNALESAILGALYEPELFVKHLPDRIRIYMLRQGMEPAAGSSCPSPMHCPHLPGQQIRSGIGALLRGLEQCPEYKVFREEVLSLAEEVYFERLMGEAGGKINIACDISGLGKSRIYDQLKKNNIGR